MTTNPRPQSTMAPTTKVMAAGVAGAVATVLIWVLSVFGIDMPEPVAAAIAVLLTVVVGYLTPSPKPPHTSS